MFCFLSYSLPSGLMIFLIRSHDELDCQRFKRYFPFQQLIDEFTILAIEECHFVGLIVDDNRLGIMPECHECFGCDESPAVSVFQVGVIDRYVVSY